jgi:hypothetical protein
MICISPVRGSNDEPHHEHISQPVFPLHDHSEGTPGGGMRQASPAQNAVDSWSCSAAVGFVRMS